MKINFHKFFGVSVLPALLVLPAMADVEIGLGTGEAVDVKIGDQFIDGGRIWLKDFKTGKYTYDDVAHTLLLEADESGKIELSSMSASIQSHNPDHDYPIVTVKGNENTVLNMVGGDWSIFSRFAPLYVGTEESPIGTINVENATENAIYVTAGNGYNDSVNQDLQIYGKDVSLSVLDGAAITGNEGRLTLVATDTLNIKGNIEGYNSVYGGHADIILNINQNEGNTAKTTIIGDINAAKNSDVNIGLKGSGSSIIGNLLVSANGTELPGGRIKLGFGEQGRITGNITAQDKGSIVITGEKPVEINGNVRVSAESSFSGQNINVTSASGTTVLATGADANVSIFGDTTISSQVVGVRADRGGYLSIGDANSVVSIYAKGDDAVESFYDNSIVDIKGSKVSLLTDATGNAAAIWAQNSTTDTDKTPATVNIAANTIDILAPGAKGVVAMSQGIVNLQGDTTIKAKEKAILARGDAQIYVNKNSDNKLKMEGNIDFNYDKATSGTKVDAIVDVTMSGTDSYWTGNTVASYSSGHAPDDSYMKVNSVALTMKNGAVWNATQITDVVNNDTSGSGYVAMNYLNIDKGTVNIKDSSRGIIVENANLTNATFNGGPLNIKNVVVSGGTNLFNTNIFGVDTESELTIASGANVNIKSNTIDVDKITLNGDMFAILDKSATDAQIKAQTFAGNGKLTLAMAETGTYHVFGGKQDIKVGGENPDVSWTIDNADTGISFANSKVYDLTWNGGDVTAEKKAVEDIAKESEIAVESAAVVSNIIESASSSSSQQMKDLSVKLQEKLAEADINPAAKAEVEHATKAINPEKESVAQAVTSSVQNTVVGLASARMSLPAAGRNGGDVNFTSGGAWAQGVYNRTKQADAFNGYTRGIALGLDGTINKRWTIGAGYSFAHSDISGSARDTDIDSNTVFLYGQYKPSEWYLNAVANYTMSNYSEKGTVIDNAFVTADYKVRSFGANVATGYDFASGVTPELGLRYMHVSTDDYANSYGIKTHMNNTNYLTGILGGKYLFNVVASEHTTFMPQLNAGFKYDLVSDGNVATVTMPGVSAYSLESSRLSRAGGEFGIGLGMHHRNLDVSLNYDIDVRQNYTSQTGMLKFRCNF